MVLNGAAWTSDRTVHALAPRGDTDIVWLGSSDGGAAWSVPITISGSQAATRTSPFICADERPRLHAVWNSYETGNLELFYAFADTAVGVEEPPTSASRPAQLADVARGVLRLAPAPSFKPQASSHLLDASGRRLLDLGPGPNNVRRLSPGVYFVCNEPSAGVVRKVVVTR